MDPYSCIFTRASTTKYDPSPLPAQTLSQIAAFISRIKPLLSDSALEYKIRARDEVKGLMLPNAPHFLIISGGDMPLRKVCAGFFGQQIELYMYSIGLATRWLSSVKAKQTDENHIVGFAFGKPAKPETRTVGDFKRKPLSEMSAGTDSRFEAVRLAPSGMNGQPWFFAAKNGVVHVYYKQKLGGLPGMMYNMTEIDLGIALAHLAVASEHENKPFKFLMAHNDAPSPPPGFTYAGSVE